MVVWTRAIYHDIFQRSLPSEVLDHLGPYSTFQQQLRQCHPVKMSKNINWNSSLVTLELLGEQKYYLGLVMQVMFKPLTFLINDQQEPFSKDFTEHAIQFL